MLNLETILTPVDFSERSTAAAEHAVALARRFHSKVIFAHVIPPLPYEYASYEGGSYAAVLGPSEDERKKFLSQQLDKLVDKVFPDPLAEKLILTGDPSRRIEEIIKKQNIGLVVMPTHGYGPFRRFVLGSVTTKVLHDVSCPVFTGTHVEEIAPYDPRPYRHIGCAVDRSEHSEKVLCWAAQFAAAYEAKLSVIHAIQGIDVHGAYEEFITPEMYKMMVEQARGKVEDLLAKMSAKGNVFIESGNPERVIPAFANDEKVDVLIIGRSADHGFLGRLRTHAYSLIRTSPCPVISV
jgi:nucleotide-binding universal stress UspA family protein